MYSLYESLFATWSSTSTAAEHGIALSLHSSGRPRMLVQPRCGTPAQHTQELAF